MNTAAVQDLLSWVSLELLVYAFSAFTALGITLVSSLMFLKRPSARRKPFKALGFLLDLIPTPRLRRRLKKLVADQAAHANQLRTEGGVTSFPVQKAGLAAEG